MPAGHWAYMRAPRVNRTGLSRGDGRFRLHNDACGLTRLALSILRCNYPHCHTAVHTASFPGVFMRPPAAVVLDELDLAWIIY